MEERHDGEKYAISTEINDDRRRFMYSPFPSNKNVNPKHWDSKIQFWKKEIMNSCRFYNDICVSGEKLSASFSDENKRSPAGLSTVLNELHSSGEIYLTDDFSNILDETWTQWGYKLLSKPVGWMWRKAWYGGFSNQTNFVVKELLEEYSLALLDAHYKSVKYEKTDHVVPWNVIKHVYKINKQPIKDDNLVSIIGYLKKKGKCKVSIMENGDKVVKFASKSQKNVEPMATIDFEIIKLKKAIAKLTLECTQLDTECKSLQNKAQHSAKNKEKDKAKRILVERRKLLKTHNLKSDAQFSMRENLRIIQEAETTKMITDAFNSSSTLLNQSYKQNGLTIERVDDIMDQAAEANDMVNEIEEALSSGINRLDDDIDMDELEKELKELEVDNIVLDLPEVPVHFPQKLENKAPSKTKKIAIPAT